MLMSSQGIKNVSLKIYICRSQFKNEISVFTGHRGALIQRQKYKVTHVSFEKEWLVVRSDPSWWVLCFHFREIVSLSE